MGPELTAGRDTGSSAASGVRFGDVVKQMGSTVSDPESVGIERFLGLEHLDPGRLRVVRWGKVAEGTTFTRHFRKGEVLFGKRRAYQRKIAVASFEGVCSGDILVFAAEPDCLVPELLPFILQSDRFFEHALKTSAGSLSPRTRWHDLANFEFALPPLPRQREIADLLWSVENSAEQWNDVAATARTASAVWASQVMQELAEAGTGELSTLAEVRTGVAKGRRFKPNEATLELPYLRVANVQAGYLDLSALKTIRVRSDEIPRYRLQAGDVLLTEGGDFDKLGRGTVWRGEVEECLHQNHVFAVRTGEQLIPEFLELAAGSLYGRRYFLSCSKQTTNLASINSSQLKAFPVPNPPVDRQAELVNRHGRIRQGVKSAVQQAEHLRVLKSALMTSLLSL